ncbi:hypothetical protein LOTGIDRAFT_236257 [Lottia gigantea]|uniref:Alpha/beta hydrolase fold-3 domain-containing protein n=1 Tax=Lottia gigantea TaxID=225164 RepID=V3ZU65_LOTGI|nr:hypothetical protein LOTGIDRAFT_236257 [Lottia gigantea]ESO84466.1 hypothetical protein LOTGIDRAFT_236257 [Lottia gigantea]
MGDITSWGEAGQKYKIHPETLDYFKILSDEGYKPLVELTVEEARQVSEERSERFAGTIDFDGNEKQYVCPSPYSKDGIPIDVYTPRGFIPSSSILVYFHGGGLVIGSRKTVKTLCQILARDGECIVVNVEYRMGPEHKAPAFFQDANTVLRWIKLNKGLLGALCTSKIGVMGDSGGGQIAATVCYDVLGIDYQILIYPMTDLACSLPSFEEFASTPGLNQAAIDWFTERAFKSEEDRKKPDYNPGLQLKQRTLPTTLIIIAQLDPLRDCGFAYRNKLNDAGVSATTVLIKGAPHGYYHLPGHFRELFAQANKHVIPFIKLFNS